MIKIIGRTNVVREFSTQKSGEADSDTREATSLKNTKKEEKMENFNGDFGNVECIPSIRNEDNVKLEDVRINQHVPENRKRAVTKSKGSKMKNRIVVVINARRNLGNSTLAIQIIPMLIPFGEEICIDVYSIDNYSSYALENTKVLNIQSKKTTDAGKALSDINFKQLVQRKNASDNIYSIIEASGKENTEAVLRLLERSEMDENISYVIPATSDIGDFDKMLDVIRRIRQFHKESKIFVALNKAKKIDKESVEKQFIAFYGSENFGLLGHMGRIKKDISAVIPIPDFAYIDIVKNVNRLSLRDSLPEAEYVCANFKKLRLEWVELEREEYDKQTRAHNFFIDLLAFRDDIAPLGVIFE